MKRAKQFGLLTLMLIFPIFIIWFLRTFGENQFSIPVYHPNAAELSSAMCSFAEGQHYIPEFQVINQENLPLSQHYFDDHISVVNFFYTSDNTISPIMSSELARVQGNFRDNARVRILSVSVDPEFDQPDVLARYADIAGAREHQWNFVTGQKDQVYELIRCGFILPVEEVDVEGIDYLYPDRFVLVDSQRRIRGYYAGTDPQDVDRLITEMKILMEEENF